MSIKITDQERLEMDSGGNAPALDNVVDRSSIERRNFLFRHYFTNYKKVDIHLIVFRVVAVLLWLGASLFDTFAYLKCIPNDFGFIIVYNLNFIAYETSAIIYASGAPAMEVSIEWIPLLIVSIVNVVFAKSNCDSKEVRVAIYWILKTVVLLVATELVYQNLVKKFPNSYMKAFNSAASAMLNQALLFSITMIFLMASGLRAVWDAADTNRHCAYKNQTCHFFNMLAPDFHEGDICEIHHIEYLKGREELRILRALMLLNIVSYSIYNQPLLQISREFPSKWYFIVKILTIFAFVLLSVAVPIISINPFGYPTIKSVFDYIEFFLVIITIPFLIYNLRISCKNQIPINDQGQHQMKKHPHIFPSFH